MLLSPDSAGLNLSPDGTLLYLGFGAYTDGGGGWLVAVDTGKSSGTPRLASAFTGGPWNGTTANSGMWGDGGAAIGYTLRASRLSLRLPCGWNGSGNRNPAMAR